ncbi:hypothetical protein Psta_3930 [Pirellula staleyi DSM 6068]|uniref:Uncharacterized protein n=1 Tax=Pirellula staleyi (strain ATCC 27377 / DSM 6068 / ICPB 4128) TaxID=530564 RepID=D2R1X3_PIRSD|nr:hypothetical protein [Pirellula staleyi]ADB18584.1 hypothetical protein Psta_3930 [Pirellula staleyi DSM 6068]
MRPKSGLMTNAKAFKVGLVVAIGWLVAEPAFAQQTTVTAPLQGNSSGFYEGIGTQWGISGKGWFFQFGGPPVQPPFAAGDPNGGANFGGGFRSGGMSGFFRLYADQGSSRSSSSAAPSVTIPNGGQGFFSDTVQRPFVMGLVPVVGDAESPLHEKLSRLQSERSAASPMPQPHEDEVATKEDLILKRSETVAASESGGGAAAGRSTAERGDVSVAEIREQKRRAEEARLVEIRELVAKADTLVSEGKTSVARSYLKMAERKAASEEERVAIAKRLAELK